jgi:hypothetical protein
MTLILLRSQMLWSAELSRFRSRRRRCAPPQAARSARPTGVRRGRRSLRPCRSGGPPDEEPAADSLQRSAPDRSRGMGAGPPADSLRSPYGCLRYQTAAPLTRSRGAVEDANASGGGASGSEMGPHRAQVGRWLRWKPGHRVRRRPRTSRADQAGNSARAQGERPVSGPARAAKPQTGGPLSAEVPRYGLVCHQGVNLQSQASQRDQDSGAGDEGKWSSEPQENAEEQVP